MATEQELRKIITQLQEKIASLSIENQMLRERLDIHKNVPQFSLAGVIK